jgi:hypothetical protein
LPPAKETIGTDDEILPPCAPAPWPTGATCDAVPQLVLRALDGPWLLEPKAQRVVLPVAPSQHCGLDQWLERSKVEEKLKDGPVIL